MKNIQTYNADSIMILEGLDAVRRRPGMYIGSVNLRGLNHLIYEILDNAVDEHMAGFCTDIEVTLDSDGSCIVKDNGRGIPVERHKKGISAERIVFTTLHAGGKFDNSSYKTSGGLHGVGSSVVNALSKLLEIKVYRDGNIYYDKYEYGKPVLELEDGLLPVIGTSDKTGTEIRFIPDDTIFEIVEFKSDWLKSRLHETAYLNPDLTIHFHDKRKGKTERVDYHEPKGLVAYIKDLTNGKDVLFEPIYVHGKMEDTEVECAFLFSNEFEENIHGFCNNIYTQEGGTHIAGLKSKFTAIINSYARQLGMLKEKDSNFTGTDTRNGMTAVIAVKYPDPIFEGQTKTKLASAAVSKNVSKILEQELELYFDRNINVVKQIISCAEKSAKIRKTEERTKTNLLSKSNFSFDSNGKLKNCISKDPEKCEIFIVEGDSAGGNAGTGRDRHFQAILPIRGKILNVEKATIDKVLANAEIKTMINAFGCGFSEGYGNDFDITKLKYNKIILMTDADVDGSHIDTLLLTFLYRFMPDLIFEGHVYIAQPPLYKVSSKRGVPKYLKNDAALEKYKKTHKDGTYSLQRYKGLGEMSPEQLWETTLNPETRTLKQVFIEDAKAASESVSLLMGNQVEPRRQFIHENADYATVDI
ncbi:DNA gyrase subunit B [Enterocloster aldenensis]|uniref:DNA gyrase/topoisomerase IV subunit B n=1 Tax=Enterocloster aldenensis TaxID=358742 RepID=UPI000E48E920|nr:DNA gyrase subunit B [Enterocloster aldenensis]